MWSVGSYLDDTSCDTDSLRFIKDELNGVIVVDEARRTVNRRRLSYVRVRGLSRTWEAFDSGQVTNKKLTAKFRKTTSGALVNETITLKNFRRGSAEIILKGRVAYMGEICTYRYDGMIAR
jgi:hypothetical protein